MGVQSFKRSSHACIPLKGRCFLCGDQKETALIVSILKLILQQKRMENLDNSEVLSENSDSDYITMSNVSRDPPVLEPEETQSLFNLLMELIWMYLCTLCR